MDKNKIIEEIIEKFFKEAPEHLIMAQIKDFELLDCDQLELILEIESFPLHDDERHLLSYIISKNLLIRLEKRVEIYEVIKEARLAGVYELAEHYMSEI